MRRLLSSLLGPALLAGAATALQAPIPAGTAAQAVVRELAEGLRSAHADAGRELAARVELLSDVVDATHDFEGIARELAGDAWAGASAADRERLVRALADFAVTSYAARLQGGVELRTGEVEVEDEGHARVRCSLAEGDDVETLEFELERVDDAWRITDAAGAGVDALADLRASTADGAVEGGVVSLAEAVEAETRLYSESAAEVVTRLQAALIDVMQRADELGYQGRHDALERTILSTHDGKALARLTLSSAWKTLEEAQQAEFLRTFQELTVATYAGQFDEYGGHAFRLQGEREVAKGVLVKSTLEKPGGKAVEFDYMLRRSDGRWQIINILVDGVSDLAVKRKEYKSIIERDGFESLLADLRRQIEEYRSGVK